MSRIPLWARKFALDTVETSLGLILALNLFFPQTVAEAGQAAVIVGGAVLSAAISAARRAAPAFLAWLAGVLGVPADDE